mgnify:CR=1 FL=1
MTTGRGAIGAGTGAAAAGLRLAAFFLADLPRAGFFFAVLRFAARRAADFLPVSFFFFFFAALFLPDLFFAFAI